MKVLLINTSEKIGGAAIACHRLMQALGKQGVETKMLVKDKQTDDTLVTSINTTGFKKRINQLRFLWERWFIFVANRFSKKNLFNVSIANTGNDISRHPLVQEADIIHLHWINQGFLSINDIRKLTKLGKAIIWTMHDQWCYTGICHYVSGCKKFETQCFECQKLCAPSKKDLSYQIFKQKEKCFKNSNILLVGCSQWIAQEAKKSSLFKTSTICSIPNPINIEFYKKQDKLTAKKRFNLPSDQKLMLFGACKVTDTRKGIDYLKTACDFLIQQNIFNHKELAIVVFGGKSEELASMLPFPLYNVGYIHQPEMMVSLYNAVDLFLIPSMEDNLPNTIMESMSCGTPCVGFNTGGIPEMIDHKTNGYVAEYKNSEDLANGIHWVLKNDDYEKLATNAREKVVKFYNEDTIAKQFIALYQSCL